MKVFDNPIIPLYEYTALSSFGPELPEDISDRILYFTSDGKIITPKRADDVYMLGSDGNTYHRSTKMRSDQYTSIVGYIVVDKMDVKSYADP